MKKLRIPSVKQTFDSLLHSTMMKSTDKLEILKEAVADKAKAALPPEWEDFVTVGFSEDCTIATVSVSDPLTKKSALESVDLTKAKEAILESGKSFDVVSRTYDAINDALAISLDDVAIARFSNVVGEPEMDLI